jgi:hypothetical protein
MKWPRRYKTYWCVSDSRGTAYLSSARIQRSKSIIAFLNDVDTRRGDWRWWRRAGYLCQRVDIKVRNAQ